MEGITNKQITDDVESIDGTFSDKSIEELCCTLTENPALLRVLGIILIKSSNHKVVVIGKHLLNNCGMCIMQ